MIHRFAPAAHGMIPPAIPLSCLLFAALVVGTKPSLALYEDVYTLPFYSSFDITCPWGPYSNCGPGLPPGNHNGTDYSLGRNTSDGEVVAAALSGKVWQFEDFTSQGVGKGCGYYIVIAHGNNLKTRYCHLKDRIVGNGAVVARGEAIGHEGHTGTSGNHLHFDARVGGSNDPSDGAIGTSVDPYGGAYSPGTWMWQDNPPNHAGFSSAVTPRHDTVCMSLA